MEIELIDEGQVLTDKQKTIMTELIKKAGAKIGAPVHAELDVTIVDNQTIRELNREYRHMDRATDVLSFALLEGEEPIDWTSIVSEEDQELINLHLGDIIISIERALEQAKEYNHSLERELGFLVVHGFLHLNGYDHQTSESEREMFAIQEEVLSEYGLTR
ncbi:rRNA maturation RNase YbeY [Facklamia miroungae]|uniref:Endoribonuclease YbeY n=1 Tax=Facklamia miroungae TaxID=120956 RepID=A0A1G7R1G4_9LACT|nr:rRNA maturation RNase YbeY [Facklamia miroungae]NKZ29146.1 rRNA maturation RNase YbeY [Facklamia miroungae]SDG04593.1 probable rRNA maturation factor [Facklamia miroungae]